MLIGTLKGILILAVVFFAGYGVMYLIYGSDGMEQHSMEEKRNRWIVFFIGILLLLWGFSLWAVVKLFRTDSPFSGPAWFFYSHTFGIPAVLVLWGILVRRRARKELSKYTWVQFVKKENPGLEVVDLRPVKTNDVPETSEVEKKPLESSPVEEQDPT